MTTKGKEKLYPVYGKEAQLLFMMQGMSLNQVMSAVEKAFPNVNITVEASREDPITFRKISDFKLMPTKKWRMT